jgi:5,6-dimethylbenzimidazole synthase
MSEHAYPAAEREAIYRVIRERRDMRHFLPDPLPEGLLRRLLEAAHQGPSVGYMQPWRFIRITDRNLRGRIHALALAEQERTAQALDERGAELRRLKLEGIRECGELLVAALCEGRERYVLGRRTLPEMDLCSLACAIQNLWLAARAEGLGMGWVSLFDPQALARLLSLPEGAAPVAVLCLGQVEAFYPEPMLETAGWDRRRDLDSLIYENHWGHTTP